MVDVKKFGDLNEQLDKDYDCHVVAVSKDEKIAAGVSGTTKDMLVLVKSILETICENENIEMSTLLGAMYRAQVECEEQERKFKSMMP